MKSLKRIYHFKKIDSTSAYLLRRRSVLRNFSFCSADFQTSGKGRTGRKWQAAYGENLENIPYGDPYVYRTIFQKYICSPMYDYFNDPANHDAIVAEYPDFPFDFPNPFE